MILRRAAEHLKQQHWTAFAIELVIVVLGVFIGMQASNWNQDRATNQQSAVFTERLKADLRDEDWGYQLLIAYNGEVLANANQAVNALDGTAAMSDEALLVSAYRATQYKQRVRRRSTYDELISTGTIGLIRDQSLRDTAMRLYNIPTFDNLVQRGQGLALPRGCPHEPAERRAARAGQALWRPLHPHGDYAAIHGILDYPCSTGLSAQDIADSAKALRSNPNIVPSAAPAHRRHRNPPGGHDRQQPRHHGTPSHHRGREAMSLIAELKRRKVFKVGGAYLVVAWLAVQAVSIGFPAFDAPPWVLRVFILVAMLGFPIALVFAWVFDGTPDGVKAEAGSTRAKYRRRSGAAAAIAAPGDGSTARVSRRTERRRARERAARPIAVLPSKHERQVGRGLFLRRHDRGIVERTGVRSRSSTSPRARRCSSSRARAATCQIGRKLGVTPHRRGQRAARGWAGAHHRAVDPRGRRFSCVVRKLRPRTQERVCGAGRHREPHRRAVAAQARRRRIARGAR